MVVLAGGGSAVPMALANGRIMKREERKGVDIRQARDFYIPSRRDFTARASQLAKVSHVPSIATFLAGGITLLWEPIRPPRE